MFKLRRWLKKGMDNARKTNHVIRGLGIKSGDYLDLWQEPAGQACGGPTPGGYGERKLQYTERGTLELSFVAHVVRGFVALTLVALLFVGKNLEDSKLCHCYSHSAISSLLAFSLTSVHHVSPLHVIFVFIILCIDITRRLNHQNRTLKPLWVATVTHQHRILRAAQTAVKATSCYLLTGGL